MRIDPRPRNQFALVMDYDELVDLYALAVFGTFAAVEPSKAPIKRISRIKGRLMQVLDPFIAQRGMAR